MDEFDADIFTFRHAPSTIVDDVVIKHGFLGDALIESLTDQEIIEIYPYSIGYQHLPFD